MDPAPLASTKSVVETIKDLTPLPATTQPLTDVHSNESRAQTLSDVPTASHQLAVASAQQPPEQATGESPSGCRSWP